MKRRRFSAAQIRQIRTKLGLTQAELAAEVGVGLGTVSTWEQGRASPGSIAARTGLQRLAELAEAEATGP